LPFSGAKVGCLDINKASVDETVNKINSEFPNSAFPMVASVTSEEELEKVYLDLKKKIGSVSVLINCAGVATLGSIDSLHANNIKIGNDVNITGYFLNASIASRFMIDEDKGGCILNISSASARGASENSSLYAVAKEAQCMMVRSWALDLGKKGIRVNAVLPGDLYGEPDLGISSGIWNQEYFEKKAVDKGLVKANDKRLGKSTLNKEIRKLVIDFYTKRTAFGKQVMYSDVVDAIVFLCSDLGSRITGESISITSGNPLAFSR
jgi:NAD(P)-dependent dehydrogenase (short-subunit alcohol dehydrogenase family)